MDVHGTKLGSRLASQSIPTWNQILSWLTEMESLRKLLPKPQVSTMVVGTDHPIIYWNHEN
jgi:hypothetical protein